MYLWRLCADTTCTLQESIASKRFKAVASQRDNAGYWSLRCVCRDLTPTSSEESRSSFLGQSVSYQEIGKLFWCPTLLRERLDGVCGHHQVFGVSPSNSIAIFNKDACQKEIFIPQGAVDFVTKNGRAYVHEVFAPRSCPFSPFHSKNEVVERLNSGQSGDWNPTIDGIIRAH
jgi:hypothetical protein